MSGSQGPTVSVAREGVNPWKLIRPRMCVPWQDASCASLRSRDCSRMPGRMGHCPWDVSGICVMTCSIFISPTTIAREEMGRATPKIAHVCWTMDTTGLNELLHSKMSSVNSTHTLDCVLIHLKQNYFSPIFKKTQTLHVRIWNNLTRQQAEKCLALHWIINGHWYLQFNLLKNRLWDRWR